MTKRERLIEAIAKEIAGLDWNVSLDERDNYRLCAEAILAPIHSALSDVTPEMVEAMKNAKWPEYDIDDPDTELATVNWRAMLGASALNGGKP